jgi:coenzyme F420 hydrogenase subunit beta
MTYEQSWGDILSKHRPFRCRICPDSTGEFADISCGDPWYREAQQNDPGCSLVLVRTELGKEILKSAIQSGYVSLTKVKPEVLPQSQESLLDRRRRLWGRLLIMRAMLIPTPYFNGFSLFENWRDLPIGKKLRSMARSLRMMTDKRKLILLGIL